MIRSLCFVAIFLFAPIAKAQDWKAGAAKITITPPKLMWMSGYGARDKPAEGTLHDLWAKALVIQNGDRKVVLVSLDLVGIDGQMSKTICDRLKSKFQLPRESIILACSHTHCGPVVGDNLKAMRELDPVQEGLIRDYSRYLPDRIEAVVGDALSRVVPAKLSWGIGQAGFAVNRRENKEADVPALKKAGAIKGPSDHDVPVLKVANAEGKLLAVAFGYACHATVLGFYQWCGDYPGFAMLELEKAHPGAVALFWAGCGADQNPIPRRTVELAEGYGKQLAASVEKVLAGSMAPITEGGLGAKYKEIPLALDELPTREKIAEDLSSKNKYIALRAKWLIEKMKAAPLAQDYPYPIQVIQLGKDLDWITLGGEVTVEYALRLKKELRPGNTWVMGYANDVMAYVPSLKVLKEGGYEGATSMIYYGQPTIWSPRVEETIITGVHGLLKR